MRYLAFLRGVNVGSANRIKMGELKAALTAAGLEEVRTYIQSGNLAFNAPGAGKQHLVDLIEAVIAASFGFKVFCLVLTREELCHIAEYNPYPDQDSGLLSLILFNGSGPPDVGKWQSGEDEAVLAGDAVYLLCRTNLHQTKLNNAFFEKQLGRPCTSRNWQTVCEMLKL